MSLGHRCGHHLTGSREQDHELLAAVTGADVLRAHPMPEPLCDGLEHLVADCVPKRVVDGLEMIDIYEQNRERVAAAHGPGNRVFKGATVM